MKQDKVVCDVCGKDTGDDRAILVLTFHPVRGMGQKQTIDLCDEHAKPTWDRVLDAIQKGELA